MAELKDFNTETSDDATLETFQSEEQPTSALNAASINNIAAKTAMIDGDDPITTYELTNLELSEGNSEGVKNSLADAQRISREENQSVITEMLGDPTLNKVDKHALAAKWAENAAKNAEMNSIIVERAVADDASPHETPDEEGTRINIAATFEKAENYRSAVQQHLNAESAKNNPALLSSVADFIEVALPFAENSLFANISTQLRSSNPVESGAAFLALGENKKAMADWFQSMPMETRLELLPKLIDIVKSSDTIIFDDTNDMLRAEFLNSIVKPGYYTTTDRIIDNVVSVLDAVGIGALLKAGATVVKGGVKSKVIAKRLADKERRIAQGEDVTSPAVQVKETEVVLSDGGVEAIQQNTVRSGVQPASPSQIMKDANPQKGRAMHQAVSLSGGDEAAKALYGTTKAEAITADMLPQVGNSQGSITSALNEPDALLEVIDTVMSGSDHLEDVMTHIRSESGANYFSRKEKIKNNALVHSKFLGVTEMQARKEMFTFRNRSDGANIKAVYGPTDGGAANPHVLKETIKPILREYGIDEGNLTLLSRSGDTHEYLPVDKTIPSNLLPDGDYLVQVDYRHRFTPGEIQYGNGLQVKWNWFDRVEALRGTGKAGSFTAHILDAASTLDPLLTHSASAQVDKSARITSIFGKVTKEFEDGMKGLTRQEADQLGDLWKEANAKGFEIDDVVATARGLSAKQKELSDLWRQTWDTLWHLENEDFKKTLRGQNYMVFTSKNSNLYAKPLQNNGKGVRAYDPQTDTVRQLTADEVNKLYETGGQVGSLRTPIDIDGEDIGKLISSNSSNGYLRRLNDNDKVLNYRKGYYHVHYKDPWFIDEVITLKDGTTKTVARATAKSQSDARVMSEKMAADSGGEKVFIDRRDKNASTVKGDSAWESMMSSGRSAQRVRGKRLTGADAGSQIETAHLMGPDEALERSIFSIARRVEMRDWSEAAKGRLMSQYIDVMPKRDGKVMFPVNAAEISASNRLNSTKSVSEINKEVADASTTFEYIRAMEDGYINIMDDGIKSSLRSVADFFGGHTNPISKGISSAAEKGSEVLRPTMIGKTAAFKLYLALNPIRQAIVQSHQLVQIAGVEPTYFATRLLPEVTMLKTMTSHFATNGKPNIVRDAFFNAASKTTGMTGADGVKMFNDWQKSGLSHAVDTHNLLRTGWEYAGRGGFVTEGGRLINKYVIDPVQKVGFDAGERANMMTAWLAFRHRAIQAGQDISKASVRDSVSAQARNFTYNMNKAGDMPYNTNALGLAMQFLQVPHKAMLQMITNRTLTKTEKGRMAAFNLMMYGTPGLYLIRDHFGDVLSDDPTVREAQTHGLESVILNSLFSTMTGDDVDVDWSNLAPVDMFGTMDVIHSLLTNGLGALADTPATQLVAEGGRVRELIKSTGRMIGVFDDYEQDPTTFGRVAVDFAKLSSGFANAHKAYTSLYAQKAVEKLNSTGNKAYAVSTTEALLQAAGFMTRTESMDWENKMRVGKDRKERTQYVREWIKDYYKHMKAEGKPDKYYRDVQKLFNEAFRVLPKDNLTFELLEREIRRKVKEGDATLHNQILKQLSWQDAGKLRDMIRSDKGMSEKQNDQFIEGINIIEQQKKEI